MKSKGKVLLNIHTGKIHNGESLCYHAKKMAAENGKWFDSFDDAAHYFDGGKKQGIRCAICFKEK